MQSWNQWPLSTGAVTTPMPQPPVGYPTPGADPMATMQAYMQYYNQPAPSGYTTEQWAAAQQQNWAQWQQWQQQYQQWQAQYGEKYQETMKHFSTQGQTAPSVSNVSNPPLPKEDTSKPPPLPPSQNNAYQFPSVPPPNQNNLPLFPSKPDSGVTTALPNYSTNPPLPTNQQAPPLPPVDSAQNKDNKRTSSSASESSSAKKLKTEDDELTEAEKTFDAQFKQWEEQFNKWKQQNANHPDKTQYKQYEAKWTSWREKLIERREQMRKKREQQRQAAAKAEAEKASKELPGGDKILNILSNTENQGLINNLLGIGKTLGLTGKQDPPPPPPPTTTVTSVQSTMVTTASQPSSLTNTGVMPPSVAQVAWNAQQWAAQYNTTVNTGMTIPNYNPFPSGVPNVPPPAIGQMPLANFTLPPPSLQNTTPNFSQPPPGFPSITANTNQSQNQQDASSFRPDKPPPSFNSSGDNRPFQFGDSNNDRGGLNNRNYDSFDRDAQNRNLNDPFRSNDSTSFGSRNDPFNKDPYSDNNKTGDSYRRGGDDFGNAGNRFNDKTDLGDGDRFGSGSNVDRFGSSGNDRFGSDNDRFGQGNNDRFGSGNDRFGSNSGDRFNKDRFGSNNDRFGGRNDRFGQSNNTGFGNSPREFPNELSPELKKLMEKRRAAMDVFKPSFLDDDKSSVKFGSLSESFKKIAGDSPFMPRAPSGDFGSKDSPTKGGFESRGFGRSSGGSGGSGGGMDFNSRGPLSEFGARGGGAGGGGNSGSFGFGRGNAFGGSNKNNDSAGFRDSSPGAFRDPLFKNQGPGGGGFRGGPMDNKFNNSSGPPNFSPRVGHEFAVDRNLDEKESEKTQQNNPMSSQVPPLERPPWMDAEFPDANVPDKSSMTDKKIDEGIESFNAPMEDKTAGSGETGVIEPQIETKKPEGLPFMGENDPKPEDLNMEPPPELPNLGPLTTSEPPPEKTESQLLGGSFDSRGAPFDGPPPLLGSRPPFSGKDPQNEGGEFPPPFGPRGVFSSTSIRPGILDQPPPSQGSGPFSSTPESNRFKPFGSHRFDEPPSFGSRGSNDGPAFGSQGPNADRFFGLRGPPPRDAMNRSTGPPGPFNLRGPKDNVPFLSQRGSANESNFRDRNPSDDFFNKDSDRGPSKPSGIPSLLDMNVPNPNLIDNFNPPRNERDDLKRDNWRPPLNNPPHMDKTLPPDNEFMNRKEIDRFGMGNNSGGGSVSKMEAPKSDFRPGGFRDNIPFSGFDTQLSRPRFQPGRDFVVAKQFNYNHGGTAPIDNTSFEHFPTKVIDYGHAPRSSFDDYITPAQSFDYAHGNLKPMVPEHEMLPRRDFRHWEENEQNLREYTETMNKYSSSRFRNNNKNKFRDRDDREPRESREQREQREPREPREMFDKKYDERKGGRDRREERDNGRNSNREFSSASSKDRFKNERGSYKKDVHKNQDKSDVSRVEKPDNDNDTNDDRSKGNINWQQSSNTNVIETPQDTSVQENKDESLDSFPKTLDLGKTSNLTMVDDILCQPGRQSRPPKIAIILRGPPGSGKSYVAKLIKDKEVEQGGSAPRILSLDDYFLVEKEIESTDDNGKKITVKEMVYEYEEAMEQSYTASLVKAFKKNITDGFFNFIILDCVNEKISDYEEMWSFAKTKGFKVYVCEMDMDVQICLKRNIHNRSEEEINRIIDYFEPTPSYHQILDVNSMLQEQTIEEVQMEDSSEVVQETTEKNEDSQDSQEDVQDSGGNVSKWEKMEAEDKLDRLDGLAKKKNEKKPQTMEDFLQVPDYYDMEDTTGKKRVRWADLEERKKQEKMRAVGFVVGHTNWDRMMDPTKGGSALIRTKYI